MDITPKQYASALYKSVKDKEKEQVKEILAEFVNILAANNDILKSEKIIVEFEKIWNKDAGLLEADIISVGELDKQSVGLLNSYIADLSKAKQVVSRQSVDKKLLGGVVLKYGDKVLDGSLKTKLNDLKEQMVK